MAVGLTAGLSLDGDRCIRVIPRHFDPNVDVDTNTNVMWQRTLNWAFFAKWNQGLPMPGLHSPHEVPWSNFKHILGSYERVSIIRSQSTYEKA